MIRKAIDIVHGTERADHGPRIPQVHSPNLGQDMELLVFGQAGQPYIVFPTSSGRFFDFENNGMVHAAERFLEEGNGPALLRRQHRSAVLGQPGKGTVGEGPQAQRL